MRASDVRSSKPSNGKHGFRAAWWLQNAHAQTMWGRFVRRIPRVPTTTECLSTPDGDQLEILSVNAEAAAPRVLLLHGLEGSSRSHYVGGILSQARARKWGASIMIFRGCGAAPNVAKRFYHSGETGDLDFAFTSLSARWPESQWF